MHWPISKYFLFPPVSNLSTQGGNFFVRGTGYLKTSMLIEIVTIHDTILEML